MAFRPQPLPPGPGQESVWDYPRPAILQPSDRHVVVRFGGGVLADTRRAWRALETSHPPTWYLPPEDVRMDWLVPLPGIGSVCEWKGPASYFDIVVPAGEGRSGAVARSAAWCYPRPTPGFAPIAGFIAVYPGRMDSCTIDGAPVRPQEGGFYGGWITDDVVGPFKGGPGTQGW
ncbi:hypothetical protein GCM10007036_29640 [Alsobacter metallidurans]|uniref:DUF427 domain-containing protein n=1 Tax=Alsobacter metallidurans TaxID=340221 RepID=A0A917I8E5_9HYPH|nr:DUF427 domain-containing protein [Alsobacter metallidurans]GGH23713.1 hypothetical protein GCM10007036_29640 [Alsobacter metallidurans]